MILATAATSGTGIDHSSARSISDAKGEEFRADLNHRPGQNPGKNTVARGVQSLGIWSRKTRILERKNSGLECRWELRSFCLCFSY